MKRLIGIVSLLVLIACAHAESKATFGLDLRSRMIMSSVGTGTNADLQYFNRYTDIRVRPNFYFQANDMLSAKVVLEIGDLKFGYAGADLGTDAKNVETKHAYLDIKPNKDQSVRLGLMAYNDPHSLIMDDDLAGLRYEGTFDNLSLGLGYYVTDDQDEVSGDKETWSFGTSLISANFGFKIDDKMSVDLTTLTQMTSTAVGTTLPLQANHMAYWLAPRFVGDFGMVNVDGTFIYNGRSATSFEKTTDAPGDAPADAKDDGSGIAFSLKSGIKANEQLTVGVNFLFASANDVKDSTKFDGYKPFEGHNGYGNTSYVDNGLQILTQGGIHDNNNLAGIFFTDYGIMLPSVTVDYMVNDMVTIGGAFGMAMTLEDVPYADKKETNLGMEFGVNGKIKLYEKLDMAPYAAFFMPGEAYSKSDDKDMQMKLGMALNIKF